MPARGAGRGRWCVLPAGGYPATPEPIARTSESTGARCDLHARAPMGNKLTKRQGAEKHGQEKTGYRHRWRMPPRGHELSAAVSAIHQWHTCPYLLERRSGEKQCKWFLGGGFGRGNPQRDVRLLAA
jgi:hypothetical protein